jgi:hypothetical protein
MTVSVREAEIDNFKILIMIKKKIFWFQVSVYYIKMVDILYTSYNLLKKFAGFFFL